MVTCNILFTRAYFFAQHFCVWASSIRFSLKFSFSLLYSLCKYDTWNNRLVPNRKRSTTRLYIVTLLISLICRVHHEKCWAGPSVLKPSLLLSHTARLAECPTRLDLSSSAHLDTKTASVPGNWWSTHRPSAGGGHLGGQDEGPWRVGRQGHVGSLGLSANVVTTQMQDHAGVGLCRRLTHLVTCGTLFFLFLMKICWNFSSITLTHIHLSVHIRKSRRRTACTPHPPPAPSSLIEGQSAFSVLGGKDFASHHCHVIQDLNPESLFQIRLECLFVHL